MVKNELCFRLTKMADIAYISVIGLFSGLLLAILSDQIFGEFNKDEINKLKDTTPHLGYYLALRLVIVVAYTGIANYIMRNTLELIPSPLNGICGLEHKRVGEIRSIPSIIFILFFLYQYDLFSYSRDYFVDWYHKTWNKIIHKKD